MWVQQVSLMLQSWERSAVPRVRQRRWHRQEGTEPVWTMHKRFRAAEACASLAQRSGTGGSGDNAAPDVVAALDGHQARLDPPSSGGSRYLARRSRASTHTYGSPKLGSDSAAALFVTGPNRILLVEKPFERAVRRLFQNRFRLAGRDRGGAV
jgi:hypothetical protein